MSELTEIPVANAQAELPPREVAPQGASLAVQVVTFFAIAVPFLGVIAAPFFLWDWGFHWTDLGVLLGMYVLTALGITVGYHRLFVHRSFETFMWEKFIWAVLGSMAVQGSLIRWVGMHRKHHQFSDTPSDPHSPQFGGHGVLGLLRGFWHAPHRLVLRGRSARPWSLRQRSHREPCFACGQCALPALGNPWSGAPGCSRRRDHAELGWRFDRLHLGRSGPGFSGASCDMECQLGLPSLGLPALQEQRYEPE